VDDILKRLGVLESSVAALVGDVREIKGILPFLATKADVECVRTEVEKVRAEVEKVRTDVAEAVSSMIKWCVGTAVALVTVSFSIAKFVH
jgi:hypothetical protein